MNRHLATHRAFGVAVIWHAGADEPAALTASAETVPPAVHYHLHLPPGTDLSGLGLALPSGDAVTTEEEEREMVTCINCDGTGRTGSTLTDEDGNTDRAPAACGLCSGTGTLPGRR